METDLQRQRERVLNLLSDLQMVVGFGGYYAVEEIGEQLKTALKEYLQSAKAENYGKQD